MKQLTIRGFGPELSQKISSMARDKGISLNQAALRLLRRGAGLGESGESEDVIGSSLDDLMGTWTEEEEREFLESIASCEEIDRESWQ